MLPQRAGDLQGVDLMLLPPLPFIACRVILAVVDGAQGDREFVAYFEAQASRLRIADVMGVRGRSAADKAGLARDEPQMLL